MLGSCFPGSNGWHKVTTAPLRERKGAPCQPGDSVCLPGRVEMDSLGKLNQPTSAVYAIKMPFLKMVFLPLSFAEASGIGPRGRSAPFRRPELARESWPTPRREEKTRDFL